MSRYQYIKGIRTDTYTGEVAPLPYKASSKPVAWRDVALALLASNVILALLLASK